MYWFHYFLQDEDDIFTVDITEENEVENVKF